MKAIVLGSTGAVGRALVNELVNSSNYEEVRAITRRDFDFGCKSPKFSQRVLKFDDLASHKDDLQGFNDVFVTMGTTRAVAGSAQNFIKIDQDLTIDATKATLTEGFEQHILYCSSAGASESSFFLYPKSKGQTERRLRELGAASTTIFRPGFLEVQQKRERAGMAENLVKPLFGGLRYLGIRSASANVAEVAKAMRIVAEDKTRVVQDPVNNATILTLCQE